jgi:hypothetical protein
MLYPTELPDHFVFRVAKIGKSFNKGKNILTFIPIYSQMLRKYSILNMHWVFLFG